MLATDPVRDREADPRPPISALFRQIADDAGTLARSEVALARAELAHNVQSLVRPLATIVIAALLGIAALFTLMGAFVAFLTPYVGAGWAALIVAAAVGIVAVILLMSGLSGFDRISLMPKRAIRSVRTDVSTVKEAVS